MKKRALKKDFFMEIKKTYNRFLSICLIVALGTAFFAGVRAANPDMQQSADEFYDSSRLMDIRVMSTLGLTDDDVSAIKAIDGVLDVMPSYSQDVLTMDGDTQLVLKMMSLPDTVNQITVDEGRLPEAPNECLADNLLIDRQGYKIGDKISVYAGDDAHIEDQLSETEYTIVGRGRSPYYLNITRDSSKIGHGQVTGFVIIPKSCFKASAYTDISITVDGALAMDGYSDAYKDKVSAVEDKIEAIADGRCEIRYQAVVGEAQDKIDEANQEIEDAQKALSDAKTELDDGWKALSDGKKEVSDNEKTLEDGKTLLAQKEQELREGQKAIQDGWASYQSGISEADRNQAVLNKKKSELEAAEQTLNESIQALDHAKAKFTEAQEQIDEGRRQIESGRQELADAQTQLTDSKSQLENAYTQADNGIKSIDGGLTELSGAISGLNGQIEQLEAAVAAGQTELSEQLDAAKSQLSDLMSQKEELTAQKSQLEAQRSAVENGLTELAGQQQALDAKKREILPVLDANEEALNKHQAELDSEIAKTQPQLDKAQQEIDDGRAQLESGRTELSSGQAQINAVYAKLAEAKKTLIEQQGVIDSGQSQINEQKEKLSDAEEQLSDAKKEIEENEQKLKDAQKEYDDAVEENTSKIEDGKADIQKAEADLKKLEVPKWYVLNRDYVQTCVEYAQDAERIGAIGNVFPVIFFLVAALVSLTTMTRMVEEERTQIGTLKALGYSKASIAAKYILYAVLATVSGGVIGTLIGQKILPYIIMRAYGIVYVTLTDYATPLHFGYTVTSILAAIVSTAVAVIAACYKELHAVPAQLMRPEAPKGGKRVLMERITFIWKHLSFSYKATVRNLFRYKKRFFMTVLGIGGCMGLLLVGFGLKDSIMTIGDRQFNVLRIYDGEITLNDEADEAQRQAVYQSLESEPNVEEIMFCHEETVDVSEDDAGLGGRSAYLFVPSELDRMDDFIVLQDRLTKKRYALDDDGAVISEKLAKLLSVSEGDNIYIEIDDMKRVPVKVTHVVENYFYHYIYMSPAMYEKIFKEAPDYMKIFMKNKEASVEYEKEFSSKYLLDENISGINFVRTTSDRIAEMIGSMDAIIYVIIISAGLLAFIVLYNLNNINISERKRELATLKVLGFYDGEVSQYVLRENILLTVFGSIFGIIFGIILHRYVILTAEIDMMMFGRNIYFRSYILSIIFTFGFSFLVNLVMHFKLKKIDMIESLKSVE